MMKYIKFWLSGQASPDPAPTVAVPEGRKQPEFPGYMQSCQDNIRRLTATKDDPLTRGEIPSLLEISYKNEQ
jgi:hypothetical protein